MRCSVCIATYNGEKYIFEQLESILTQLGTDDEVIIADDSSTDNTLKIISSFNDKRIKIFRNNQFKNPIYNFEFALKQASGDFIFLSDQDDIWLPGKVTYYLERLRTHDLVMTDCRIINENNEFIYQSYFDLKKSGKGIIKNIYKNTYFGACIGFNRKVLDAILPFPGGIPMHDIWIGITAELVGKVMFDRSIFQDHRRHTNNFSSTGGNSRSNILKLIMLRINIIKYIPLILWRKFISH